MNKSPIIVPNKEYDKEQKTLLYCAIEIYQVSDSYDSNKVLGRIKDYCSLKKCKYVIMLHDSDYYSEDTFNSNRELVGTKGQKKSNHYHCLIAFKNRVTLNDIAFDFGIEDRWIKILKKSSDYDNMIVYLSHIKYDENIKHHYPRECYDSNILDYCYYLYDNALIDIENKKYNIIYHTNEILNNDKYKISFNVIVTELQNKGHYPIEIKTYWSMIRDLVNEHNMKAEKMEIFNSANDLAMTKSIDKTLIKLSEVDTTGFAVIENDGNRYGIYKIKEGKK